MVKISVRHDKIYILGAKGWDGRAYLQVERELGKIHRKDPADIYIIEKNNSGDHVFEVLRKDNLPVIAVTTSKDIKKREKHPDTMDKNEMVRWMLVMIQERRIIFPVRDTSATKELKRQLSIFEEKKTASGSVSYAAPGKEHDDFVMALMLACFVAKRRLSQGSGELVVRTRKVSGYSENDLFGLRDGLISLGREIYYPPGSSRY